MEQRTATSIINKLKEMVESKKIIPREWWIEAAFDLNLLRIDEAQLFNRMKQRVAEMKMELKKKQDKVNISAIEMEVEATDEYRLMRDQEDLIYSIDQFVMVAKKSADMTL